MYVEDPQITLARNLRKLIKLYKKRHGVSYRQFLKNAGVPHSVMWNLMNQKHWPTPKTLVKICSALGVPVEVLFRR